MSFLHDSFWQFIISTIIAILGIIIPLIVSQAQSKGKGGGGGGGPSYSNYSGRSGHWIVPTVIISIFLILFIAFNGIIFTLIAKTINGFPFNISTLTSGTPDQTLSSYCSDIQSGAYQQAYDEYSTNLKSRVSSSQLTQMWSDQHLDGCTHDTVSTTGNGASATLSTHDFFTKATANYKITLIEDGNNGWRIDSITQE